MKEDSLSKLSLDELKAREKTLRFTSGLFIGCLIMMALAGAFLTVQQGFNTFTVLPVAFLPLMLVNVYNLKKVRTEIAGRTA
ncbi:hypothetical protein [Arsenicibacter rosenii]|uniref:Redox-active disulfide protein 2 n=1 Tax=Arsenicibacter rosenii TaxID=1750698 RepID=A0A1S2VGQ6_9BACT|nr:hypothetical protein [Arsenicibacter rosenii]OIN57913.1 hypothetical protein BLX24_17635 [Arsenicibacter rosenii]